MVARQIMAAGPVEALQSDAVALDEERIVAELARLGVSYLSRQTAISETANEVPVELVDLLVAVVRQPSARVRAATIALFLAQPSSWKSVERAQTQLRPKHRLTLSLFYSAAVQLQRLHGSALRTMLGPAWEPLPDLFAEELGLHDVASPESRIAEIARIHRSRTGSYLNWEGTYRQAADRLLRQRALEAQWSQ